MMNTWNLWYNNRKPYQKWEPLYNEIYQFWKGNTFEVTLPLGKMYNFRNDSKHILFKDSTEACSIQMYISFF